MKLRLRSLESEARDVRTAMHRANTDQKALVTEYRSLAESERKGPLGKDVLSQVALLGKEVEHLEGRLARIREAEARVQELLSKLATKGVTPVKEDVIDSVLDEVLRDEEALFKEGLAIDELRNRSLDRGTLILDEGALEAAAALLLPDEVDSTQSVEDVTDVEDEGLARAKDEGGERLREDTGGVEDEDMEVS